MAYNILDEIIKEILDTKDYDNIYADFEDDLCLGLCKSELESLIRRAKLSMFESTVIRIYASGLKDSEIANCINCFFISIGIDVNVSRISIKQVRYKAAFKIKSLPNQRYIGLISVLKQAFGKEYL